MVEDQLDIRQSLQILFSTLPGERIMRPDYGCDLNAYIFENISEDLLADIRRTIRDNIQRHEQRVEPLDIIIKQNKLQPTQLDITLHYRIRGTDDSGRVRGELKIVASEGGLLL